FLLVQTSGWGEVTPPSGTYDRHEALTLTATPRSGWFFDSWSGDVSGADNPLTVTLSGDMSIVATFYQPTPYPNWNGTAVRKILQTFAWGGFPTEEQIALWAAMMPEEAIEEMLTFEPTNDKLSPPDVDALGSKIPPYIPEEGGGQLEGIVRYFSEDPDGLLDDEERRAAFGVILLDASSYAWDMAVRARGINTFYHRIGFWETNYHMATSVSAGVQPWPMLRHYDNIMNALEADRPYHEVLAQGALNSAVAYQYGHNFNQWDSAKNEFIGNEDFAREFHQLFFGILGDVNFGGEAYHQNHEFISIKNTAIALTGLNAYYRVVEEGGPDVEIDFEAEIDTHHAAGLTILDEIITGYSAKEKIEALAAVASWCGHVALRGAPWLHVVKWLLRIARNRL
ncbi:MAG: hypothetical protein QF464_21620, partial [Myxococcota bacterium]|nr:hypothetical protein [Myxococcota bacterium]